MNFKEAIEKREHLIALGQTSIHLYGDDAKDAPWHLASAVKSGGSWRLSGPVSFYVVAEHMGLTFEWCVDMETSDANGRGVSMIDRGKLRETVLRLPPPARQSLGSFLEIQVLPGMKARSDEIRDALNKQLDSEDCVRGAIAFVNESIADN